MKYMQTGGFQNHPLMRLTLTLTLVFLSGFWVTNAALYFQKMGLTPSSVVDYYRGSEAQYTQPRSYQSLLEVTHMHLPMMALVILMLTHLLIFSPFSYKFKVGFIAVSFGSGFLSEASSWLVRYSSPAFAWLKIISFLTFQTALAFLLVSLGLFLWHWGRAERSS